MQRLPRFSRRDDVPFTDGMDVFSDKGEHSARGGSAGPLRKRLGDYHLDSRNGSEFRKLRLGPVTDVAAHFGVSPRGDGVASIQLRVAA